MQSTPERSTVRVDAFTVCTAFGVLLFGAAVLLAIKDLSDGGDYAFWIALTDFASIVTVSVLVLLCAMQLGNAPWGANLRRSAPIIGLAIIVASVALSIYDAGEFDDEFWTVLNDLFYYIPITLAVAVYLSATEQNDRVLGMPSLYGRVLAVLALVIGLAIAINDVSNADSDEFWVFLSSFGITGGLALFLLAVSLEPRERMITYQGGQIRPVELLNDTRLPKWLAIGGVTVVAAGILLGFKALDAFDDGFWVLLQDWGVYLGLGSMILIASGGRVGAYVRGDHPYLRYAIIAGLVAMFIAGLKFAADADSDQFWEFLYEAIAYPGFLALAYAMFEASRVRRTDGQRARPDV
jgi:hypothetical protein